MQSTTANQHPVDEEIKLNGISLVTQVRSLLSRWFHIGDNFLIEVQGNRIAVARISASKWRSRTKQVTVVQLDAAKTKEQLRVLGYGGQPTAVFLHPPAVCVKTFKIGKQSPSKWIAEHLQELSPIGNRNDLMLCFDQTQTGWLVLALVRRSYLLQLRDTLWGAGMAIKGFYPAATIAAQAGGNGANSEHSQIWLLSDYQCRMDEENFSIMPKVIQLEIQSRAAILNSALNDVVARLSNPRLSEHSSTCDESRFDFAIQIRLPRTYPTGWIVRILKISTPLLAALICLESLNWGARAIFEHTLADEISTLEAEAKSLAAIRSENLSRQLRLSCLQQKILRQPKLAPLLAGITEELPDQSWLTSVRIRFDDSRRQYGFAISGFAYNEGEPAKLVGALAKRKEFQDVVLTKAALIDEIRGTAGSKAPNRMTRFELSGRLSR